MKMISSPTDRFYSFSGRRNPFVLAQQHLRPELTKRQWRSLRQLRSTPALERELAKHLPDMPQVTLRGQSDESRRSYYAFLISSTPIEDRLSPEEASPPLFFRKLYASVLIAAATGISHWKHIPQSSSLLISIYTVSGSSHGFRHTKADIYMGYGTLTTGVDGQSITTFPTFLPGRTELGFVAFEKEDVLAGNNVQSSALPLNLAGQRVYQRRNAVFYNAVLELMLNLARQNWQPAE